MPNPPTIGYGLGMAGLARSISGPGLRRFSWRRRVCGLPVVTLIGVSVLGWWGFTIAQHFQRVPAATLASAGTFTFASSDGKWKHVEIKGFAGAGSVPVEQLIADLPERPDRVVMVEVGEYTQPWPQPWPNCLRHRGIHAPFDELKLSLRTPVEVWPAANTPVADAEVAALRSAMADVLRAQPATAAAADTISGAAGTVHVLVWRRLGWWGVTVGKWLALGAVLAGCVRAVAPTRGEVRADRKARGLCEHCGYPIAETGICPECGYQPRAPSDSTASASSSES